MRATTESYKALLADPDGLMGVKIIVNGDADNPILLDNVDQLNVRSSLFGEDGGFSVGNAASAIADIILTDIESAEIPRAAELQVFFQLSNGASSSDWMPVGTMIVDHRTDDPVGNQLTLECFDDMMKAEAEWFPNGTGETSWPMNELEAMQDIASKMGVQIDSRTESILSGYSLPYPEYGQTMRDTLRFIAASHMSNAVITADRKLRLVPLVPSETGETLNMPDVSELDTSSPFSAVSGVTLVADDGAEEGFTAGDATGYMLTAVCPWASQSMADSCLQQVRGYVYTPMTLTDAMPDPTIELGDEMTTEGVEWPLCAIDFEYGKIWSADLSAPADQEVDHEYPYKSSAERRIASIKKAVNETSIKVDEQAGEIELCVKKDGVISSINASEEGVKIAAALIQLLGDVSVGPDGKVRIADGAVTAEKLSVDRLESIVAKIGGFNISNDALYNNYVVLNNSGSLNGGYLSFMPSEESDSKEYYSTHTQTGYLVNMLTTGEALVALRGNRDSDLYGLLSLANPQKNRYLDLDGNGTISFYKNGYGSPVRIDTGLNITGDLKINGNAFDPTDVSSKFTPITTNVSGHSATVKYFPALGMVYFRLYVKAGDKSLSANTGYDIGKISSEYAPTQQEALSMVCGKVGNATILTAGTVRIVLANAVNSGTNYAAYITGVWFV